MYISKWYSKEVVKFNNTEWTGRSEIMSSDSIITNFGVCVVPYSPWNSILEAITIPLNRIQLEVFYFAFVFMKMHNMTTNEIQKKNRQERLFRSASKLKPETMSFSSNSSLLSTNRQCISDFASSSKREIRSLFV